MSFDGGNQFIEFTLSGVLTPDGFNPPVVADTVPTGNWYGTFDVLTSSGIAGTIDLAPNTGQTFFIDNEDDRFTFGLNEDLGGANINFLVVGNVTVQPIPVPAAVWLFAGALAALAGLRRSATSG